MLKIQCALIKNDELIAIEVEVSPTHSVHNLREDIRANISPRLDHLTADRLTLVRICKPEIGGLTSGELLASGDLLKLEAYGTRPVQQDDAVSQFFPSRGACLTTDGKMFARMWTTSTPPYSRVTTQ
ncbi:hypothetical protein HDU81_006250 [Chytriomyces hyalinus]|nr:hypothetical protein HDU81_006250 [Chytriomyces hyalinus]